jgi:hypothetical protein
MKTNTSIEPVGNNGISQVDMSNAIINALPGGKRLSTVQAAGLAVASMATGLSPFLGEIHMTPIGVMKAAVSDLARFNEWLEAHDDKAEFTYHEPTEEVYKTYAIGPRDTIIEVHLHLQSLFKAWRAQGDALKAWGATYKEIIAEIGSEAPFYTGYGIVRFDEQKDDPPSQRDGRTAVEKWAEMDIKYSRLDRARKRGRTALIRSVCPVTVEQYRRMHYQRELALEVQVVHTTHEARARLLGRSDDESLIDAQGAQRQQHAPVEGDIERAPDAPATTEPAVGATDDDDVIEGQAEAVPAQSAPVQAPQPQDTPEELLRLKARVDSAARRYAENNRQVSERLSKFLFVLLHKELCGGREEKRKTITEFLTGFAHFPDIPPCYLLALKDEFLKPRDSGDGRSTVDPAAVGLADQIVHEMARRQGQQEMFQ